MAPLGGTSRCLLGTANLVFQTLLGVWPVAASVPVTGEFSERVRRYCKGLVREAGEQIFWEDPDNDYEERLVGFVDELLDDVDFCAEMDSIAGAANEIAMVSGLTQVLLRVLSPGVSDTYQGNELWYDSLVDLDNRRPVDFGRRAQALRWLREEVDAESSWRDRADGRVKLWVLHQALGLRRDRPELLSALGISHCTQKERWLTMSRRSPATT